MAASLAAEVAIRPMSRSACPLRATLTPLVRIDGIPPSALSGMSALSAALARVLISLRPPPCAEDVEQSQMMIMQTGGFS
jgi:hypothetical protein